MRHALERVIVTEADSVKSWDFWQWLLLPFIVAMLTLSYLEGLSKIVVLYGLIISFLFLIYFIYNRLSMPPEVVVYFGWIIWSIGGLSSAVDMDLYLQTLKTVIQIGILIFLVASITALRRNLSTAMLAIMIGGTIVAISTFYTGEFQEIPSINAKARAAGMTENANEFAYVLLFVAIASAYFAKRKSSLWWRFFIVAASLMSFVGILYSGSRKGFLSLLVFIFLWWLFCRERRAAANPLKGMLILFLLLGGIYLCVDYVISDTYLGQRLQDLDNSGDENRLQMYKDGFEMIVSHPIFGVGLNNYKVFSTSGLYSHSDYIEVASNTGLIGFILYFSIYFIVWSRLNQLKRLTCDPQISYTVGLFKASIITMLLVGFGRPNINSKLTWIFLASAIGYSWATRRFLLRAIYTMRNDAASAAFMHDRSDAATFAGRKSNK